MRNYILSTLGICLAITAGISIPLWLSSSDDGFPYYSKEVTQNVFENSVDFGQHYEIAVLTTTIGTPHSDSLFKEEERQRNAPYVLITSYKGEHVFDFGTFKEIDSLKCIRFKEMKEKAIEIDRKELIARYKAKKKERELELLNKPCQ